MKIYRVSRQLDRPQRQWGLDDECTILYHYEWGATIRDDNDNGNKEQQACTKKCGTVVKCWAFVNGPPETNTIKMK